MKATVELISRLVEAAYAGATEGVSLDAAKNDAISAVFGGGSPMAQPATIRAGRVPLRDALVHATDAELAELETKLTAAEGAAHLNGEAAELETTVAALESLIKF